MNTSLALAIIGSVMGLFGIVFNISPIAVNKVIMGNLGEEAVNPAAALRVIIGGSAIAISITALYCKNLPAEQASTLLVALGIGFIVLIAAIVSTKIRGFSDHIPIPPVVSFIILTFVAFYTASNANQIDSIKSAIKCPLVMGFIICRLKYERLV